MQANNSKLAIRFLPSMLDFAFLMPIVFIFSQLGGMQQVLADGDTGWHIRAGEWIAAHHAVPTHDIFSYSKPDAVWYAWEWLSDLLFAGLNAHGGMAAVALAAILLISTVITILFLLARQKSNAVVAIALTALAVVPSSIHWLARPHLFTMFFLVLFYAALERVRAGRTRLAGIPYLAILPAATILWTNLHGGFVAGIVMVCAYGCGEFLQFALSSDREAGHAALTRGLRYLACAFACLAASLVNPYTFHLHQHVIAYLRDPYYALHISEFFSLSFHHPIAIFFEAMLLLGAGAAFQSFKKGSYTEGVLLLVWAHAALLSTRNIPLFMIIAVPPVAAMLSDWLAGAPDFNVAGWLRAAARKFNTVAADLTETDRIGRLHVLSAAGVLLVAALLFSPNPPKKFRAEFDPKNYPASAVSMIARDPGARVFAPDQWGDYLIYKLYPHTRVFVDGRSDFYGPDFVQKSVDALNVKYGWEQTLDKFGVNTILLPPSMPLAGALKECSRWRLVYDDGVALVFRSASRTVGEPVSAASGTSRDREITKTQASGLTTKTQSTT
ncbi:MAG: hypothetical protein ABSG03_30540 [Bryobacteraceae bacterium]